ncbi:two-component sensor histidine kinase [Anaerocolumna cellulosilytica]|uniref:histidine kinase n=2 Tax=Anaerocolumna cellulosilytica TaxID=433286 RepID=A0A6S6QRQ4_9FIRM|nr:two-component sensor histidine kinase [Anaerocolumna cellulosilytica]
MKSQNEALYKAEEEDNKEELIKRLYMGVYSLYKDIVIQNKEDEYITSSELYLPKLQKDISNIENEENYEEYSANEPYNKKVNFIQSFDIMLDDWSREFYGPTLDMYGLEYYIRDDKTSNFLTNSIADLSMLTEETGTGGLSENYAFYTVLKYDEAGKLSIPVFYGLEENKKEQLKGLEATKTVIREYFDAKYYQYSQYFNGLKGPENQTIIFAAKGSEFYNVYTTYNNTWQSDSYAFHQVGFIYVFIAALAIITLLGLLLPFIKPFQIGQGLAAKLLIELCIVGIGAVLGLYESLVIMGTETAQETFLIFDKTIISSFGAKIINYSLNYVIWLGVFFLWFIAILSIRSVFTKGLKRYIKENTILGICYVICKKTILSIRKIDLREASNKHILKIVAINFIVLVLFCTMWVAGIVALIPYSIVLFFILRKYYQDLRQKHQILLEATGKMGKGNLEVGIPEELGVFEPLKEELTKLQIGFKKAVEEEMKSQRMKTDLITNVSHDLKTPLTAIITYINLLKDNNLTEEERNSYIETLDKKSMRLKYLIEDLFEMSKATSKTVTMNLVEVDITALIKQVQLELADKVEASEIEFRTSFPEEKVILLLDSEKTYRIIENLYINILKYAMTHTRAYVEVKDLGEVVTVILKNVSATEMDFNTEEISERFVRGDKSRNTEGSGLGLAIVKSFVELQGGRFTLQVDGDLFKVILEFMKRPNNQTNDIGADES